MSQNDKETSLDRFHAFINKYLNSHSDDMVFKEEISQAYNELIAETDYQQIIEFLNVWKSLFDGVYKDLKNHHLAKWDLISSEGIRVCLHVIRYYPKLSSKGQVKLVSQIKYIIRLLLNISIHYFKNHTVGLNSKQIVNVITNLIDLAEVITSTSLDLKSLADSWKLIIQVIGDFGEVLGDESISIVKRTLTIFCNQISNAITQTEASKNLPIKLKLSIFFLHSIKMLCQNSIKTVDTESSKILILYNTFLSFKYKAFKSHQDFISKMSDYFSKIYQKIYKNGTVLQSLTGNMELELLLETVKNLIYESSEFLHKVLVQFGLFDELLKCISENNRVLENSNIFKNTIEVLTALRISQDSDSPFNRIFDQRIASGVLQTSVGLAMICIHIVLQRLRFMDPLQREKAFNFWIDIRVRFHVLTESFGIKHVEILLVFIFDILPLATQKKIFESTGTKMFLCIFTLQRVPDSKGMTDLKTGIVHELIQYFGDNTQKWDKEGLNNFAENLKIVSNINLHNNELNDNILKLLSFLIGYSSENISLLRLCLKFLICQDPIFRADLVENMFEELRKKDNGLIQYFYIFIYNLLNSESHKTVTENFIKTLSSNYMLSIFIQRSKEKENGDPFEMSFKRRRLDFTSTPLGKLIGGGRSDEKLIEHSLEKMCSDVSDLKASLKRPLTNVESRLTKKIIQNLQSIM
ncbi:hypothetical protein ACFFRR_005130 [Megaselia abdita]